MIFLKKIEAKGFKSYANNVIMNFTEKMVGIVGPNGAGKSNVIDAIKWVLGEKSNKVLRGKKSDDMIFHGSTNMKASDYAEVTLTFSNHNKVLYSDLNEISVTRKLFRGSGNNEYYINGKPARLRDIQEIFLDTGLSKGSLCIISQGTVNWFADAKPEERRKIFEEAAGIGRYTKFKQESLNQLERANNNFNRVSDLVKELSRDLKKLEAQSEKLEKYKIYKEELTELELKILVKDILENQAKLDELNKKILNSEKEKSFVSPKLISLQDEYNLYENFIKEADLLIDEVNTNLHSLNSQINSLEIKKSIFENDVKSRVESNNKEEKLEGLSLNINNLESEINNKKRLLEINQTELSELNIDLDNLNKEKDILTNEFIKFNSELSSKSTILETLKNNNTNRSNIPDGARAIIENKEAISGIHGLISDSIKMDSEYEKAILTSLGSNVYNVIVNTNNDARKAIEFLKNNKAGFATFMPVYNLKPKYINDEFLNVAGELEGYINVASNLVKYENRIFKSVIDTLLARTIIADNITNAIEISKYTNQLYKIVTIDGDIVSPGGIMRGGYNRTSESVFNLDEKISKIESEIHDLTNNIREHKLGIESNSIKLSEISSKISEKRINISKYEEFIQKSNSEISLLKAEYEKLSNKSYESSATGSVSEYDAICHKLNTLILEKESALEKLNINQEKRNSLRTKLTEVNNNINESRKIMDESSDVLIKYKEEHGRCESTLQYSKEKINVEYKMTIEFAVSNYNIPLTISDGEARDRIRKLGKNIEYLGDINMGAKKELEEKKLRMGDLEKELHDAEDVRNKLLEIIQKSDEKAIDDFKNVVTKINEELPEIFKYLFGGGSCKIEFTDEDNILESGIDVLASPPGKKINSLFALSGGEKTLVALSVLFSILKTSHFPLVILDEAESALDPSNVERFGNIISHFSKDTQFLIITHRPGTMERCDSLYGATMETKGITSMYKVELNDAKNKFSDSE